MCARDERGRLVSRRVVRSQSSEREVGEVVLAVPCAVQLAVPFAVPLAISATSSIT